MRHSVTHTTPARGTAFLNLRAWAIGQAWIAGLYRRLPEALRERVAQRYVSQLAASARFPALPPIPEARPTEVGREPAATAAGGANLFAYFRGQFGLGEAARAYATSLMQAGYPVALNDVTISLPHGFEDLALGGLLDTQAPYPINIIFVNPDYFDAAVASIGQAKMQGRYVIACWFWELERVPDAWLPAIDQVDEIMVASTFIEQAFRKVTSKPVTKVLLPLGKRADSGIGRAEFGLNPDDFIFLTSFDFHSWIERKNPFAVIEAFRAAFPDAASRVKLLIKTSNGTLHPGAFSRLLGESQADPRIIVRDGILDRAHLRALQRCCDAFVSLHRAEGFGLGLAECMELGKPVVATAWSGNLDFMSAENSCLVPYKFVSIGPGKYLHAQGQRWADADIEHAAACMQRLFEDPQYAHEVGAKAAADVTSLLSPTSAVRPLIRRLDELSRVIADKGLKSVVAAQSEAAP